MRTDIVELKEKLELLESNDERLNMIWMWILQKRINRRIFKELLTVIK